LQLAAPPLVQPSRALRQFRYVEGYTRDLGCQSIAVEDQYIDRDYMEDHSVFYSKSLYPYANCCRRVHFFSLDTAGVQEALARIIKTGSCSGSDAYRQACREFSEQSYLGFNVIKPLHGSPVGRTVLKCYPELPKDTSDVSRRDFGGTRQYRAHLLGVQLSVRGLAFQQQDVGVSACATTAVWSALQKMREHEDITPITPAQITSLAAKYSLPFGRAMPSEGLSIDQMCQAVQAVGVSPNVFRADRLADTRGYLYSAIRSGLAPVLILERDKNYHAVTAVGMKLRRLHERSLIVDSTDDLAGDLLAVYVHDDRYGPYLKAVVEDRGGVPWLSLTLRAPASETQLWRVSHILVPVHSKIRLSLAALREWALNLTVTLHQFREVLELRVLKAPIVDATIGFECWVVRAPRYIESVFINASDVDPKRIRELCEKIPMARYLGVVRLSAAYVDPIDVLIDSTSTEKNPHFLGVFAPRSSSNVTEYVVRWIARQCKCEAVY
jgi:hypothetical protein